MGVSDTIYFTHFFFLLGVVVVMMVVSIFGIGFVLFQDISLFYSSYCD